MNVLNYAAVCESNWKRNLGEMSGYKPFTTFYSDLSIGDFFGLNGVKDTYKNVVGSWLNDYKYFTEFVLCLNHKAWEMDARRRKGNDFFGNDKLNKLCALYSELYEKGWDEFYEKYKDDDTALEYYYNVMD